MANENTQASPLGRNWKLWGGVLALIVVAIIISFFIPSGDDDPAGSQNNQPPTASDDPAQEQPEPSATDEGQCPSLSTDTAMPTEAPETEWQRHPLGMIVPTSEEHGPAVHGDGFWGCYSQTPSGALFAGLGMLSNISAGHEEAATDSPNRDAFMESNAVDGSDELPNVEDYRIIMADKDEAVIEYTLRNSEAEAYIQVDLVWSEDEQDWRLNLEDNNEPVTGGAITDPSAYVSWR